MDEKNMMIMIIIIVIVMIIFLFCIMDTRSKQNL